MPRSASAQVDVKRAQAAAAHDRIEAHGQELSIADEEYNVARIERRRIGAQAARAKELESAAAGRWSRYRDQLSARARSLYMHPGAALDAWLSPRSFTEMVRAQKYGSEVLTADSDLVAKAEAARQELITRVRRLDVLEEQAIRTEHELAARRDVVTSALASQRRLLNSVKADLTRLITAQREVDVGGAKESRQAVRPESTKADRNRLLSEVTAAPPSEESPAGPPAAVRANAAKAVAVAVAQIGKPYEWAAAGPGSFDCSGLTLYAWDAAGVALPHSSRAQYASLPHIARDDLQPGDLLFYGSPIHHVGIYEGGGVMINAPQTGEQVRRDSITRSDFVGAARP